MIKAPTIDYIMDDPREGARLEAKVDPEAWAQKYMADRIAPGMDVLSVGCGPGVILAAVCALHSSVRGTGIDVSADRVQEAIRKNRGNAQLRFVCGDALAMPFEANSFDVVDCRMLLQYLKNKERAVEEMGRVCRPGGTVLLQDLDGQLLWHYPEDAAMQSATQKVVAALQNTGFDPFVGRKLFSFAKHAGLENIHVQAESYHLVAGEIGQEALKQWELKLEIARPHMARIFGNDREAGEHIRKFIDYLRRPDTLTYSTVFTVSGEKPFEHPARRAATHEGRAGRHTIFRSK